VERGAGAISAVSWRLLAPPVDALGIAQRVGFAFGNGILSAGVAFIGVTLLARLFGIITPFQLLELAHPRQPLLKRLAQDAPGTYYHSMIVGNLAEKAVEEIGGDPLLTRVAVFYHDIGKALHPAYFIENQANMRNIHDTLDPYTSARIIITHVTDGVAMAEEARLPRPIIDVIAQHHGTTRTEVFYQKAKEHDGDAVDAGAFRYPGPIPQTKEAAVIMLADATEAATRAANRAGRLNVDAGAVAGDVEATRTAAIRTIVERIVQDRLKTGQLAAAPLTLRDLDAIQRTFVAVLDGMYHPRIDYPQPTLSPTPAPDATELVTIPAGTGGEAEPATAGHAD
jgi:cyclic-di-AMP phosphodiesterase PgpH